VTFLKKKIVSQTVTLWYKVLHMQLSDLVFILLFLTAVVTLLAAVWFALRRQFARSRRILFRLSAGAAIYMAIVVVTSLVLPRRVLSVGDPQCFDDWCVSIPAFRRVPETNRVAYGVDLRLFSRARRVSQRERNLAVYLTDNRGRRYDPVADQNAAALDVLLGPQESVVVSRSFAVPTEAQDVGAVVTHEGGFPIGWFIIGYDTWFRKPPIVRF
jgi:hypothetical protein